MSNILDFFDSDDSEEKKLSIDLMARRIVMASAAYYGLDTPYISDQEYDDYCKKVYDNWDMLNKPRQFMLGSKEELHASGFHVKVTTYAISTLAYVYKSRGIDRLIIPTAPAKKHKLIGSWWNCNEFRFEE